MSVLIHEDTIGRQLERTMGTDSSLIISPLRAKAFGKTGEIEGSISTELSGPVCGLPSAGGARAHFPKQRLVIEPRKIDAFLFIPSLDTSRTH